MSIIISKIKNGLITGEDMWLSILMTSAIIIGLGWCLTVAWQRNHYLQERLAGLAKGKIQLGAICQIALAMAVIGIICTTYLAYMTLVDGITMFLCYSAISLLIGKVFSGEWQILPAKTSTVVYCIVAAVLIVYIKVNGPFLSTPSLVVFAIAVAEGLNNICRLVTQVPKSK